MELAGIEPASVGWLPAALRPFPCSWLVAATLPGELDHKGLPPVLSPGSGVFPVCQRSFPAVHYRFWCQAAAVRPRVPLLVAMILYLLTGLGGENEIVLIGVSVGAPFWESEQLRSHVGTSWFQRRNRSAPLCMFVCQNAFPVA